MKTWWAPVSNAIAAHGPGGYVVVFPSYRPDLAEEMANALSCAFIDFRREKMAPLGMSAHRLDLAEIIGCADETAGTAGIVLHNAEALLAARSADIRRDFCAGFLAAPRTNIAILPLALFGQDMADHPRVIRLESDSLPAETMLRQLASMRFQ